MMIRIMTPNGEQHDINADPKDVSEENQSLIIRKNNTIIGKFRRYTNWYTTD